MPSYLRGTIINHPSIYPASNQLHPFSLDKTNHKTTSYDHYGASPHSYVSILLWSEPGTRWSSH
ncbi:hypothetical protein GQ53DRAFT_754606, partial [Thozetella sp. PMI_491]